MNTKREPVDVSKFAGHTPGQWIAVKPPGAPYYGIDTDSPEVCAPTVAGTSSGLSAADSALCAAAPDLLAEVIDLRAQLTAKELQLDEAQRECATLRGLLAGVDQSTRIAELEAKCAAMDVLSRGIWDAAIARGKEG
jgi:hypothetical protein